MTRDAAQMGYPAGTEAMFNSMRSSDGLPSVSRSIEKTSRFIFVCFFTDCST